MSFHLPEPWHYELDEDGDNFILLGSDKDWGGVEILRKCTHMHREPAIAEIEANFQRIVACVNACQGINTSILEQVAKGQAELSVDMRDRDHENE